MLLRLLLGMLFNWIFGNPDRIEQDYRPWPTWVVVVLLLLLVGAFAGVFAYFLYR